MSEQWKVGDKVRLTGQGWGTGKYRTGAKHLVTGVLSDRKVQLEGDTHFWRIYEGWEIELVERAEEKKMGIDISEVNVGDKVKLTRANGDEATFTVTFHHRDCLDAAQNTYGVGAGDTLEILEKKFELVPGLYANGPSSDGSYAVAVAKDGKTYFHSLSWVDADPHEANTQAYKAVRELDGWNRIVTF